MATVYKPAQVQGTAGTSTYATLYTTPAATEAVISSIVICNRAASVATFRIGIDTSAGTPTDSEFLVYDATVEGNSTIALTLGVCLDAQKYIRVSSSADTVTFSAFVSEIS